MKVEITTAQLTFFRVVSVEAEVEIMALSQPHDTHDLMLEIKDGDVGTIEGNALRVLLGLELEMYRRHD